MKKQNLNKLNKLNKSFSTDFINGNKRYQVENRKNLKKLLLNEISDYIHREMETEHGICASVSWVVSQSLMAFGIQTRTLNVEYALGNPAAIKLLEAEGFEKLKELVWKVDPENFKEGDLWTASAGIQDRNKEFIGSDLHVVIEFVDGSIMDLSAKSLSRPKRNMIINNFWSHPNRLPLFIWSYRPLRDKIITTGVILYHPNLIEIVNHVISRIGQVINSPRIPVLEKLTDQLIQARLKFEKEFGTWEKYKATVRPILEKNVQKARNPTKKD